MSFLFSKLLQFYLVLSWVYITPWPVWDLSGGLSFDSVLSVFNMVCRAILLVLRAERWGIIYYSLSCPPTTMPLSEIKQQEKRQRERQRETKRGRNVYFPNSFVTPAILIGNESSPAIFTVLGACASQMLPLLLKVSRSLSLNQDVPLELLSVHAHDHFSVSGSLETATRLGDMREKKIINSLPLAQYSSSICLFRLPFLSPQKDPPCICLGFLSAFLERDRVEYSDSILPKTETHSHFILIYVLMHLVRYFHNYKCVYFHVSSFFLLMVNPLEQGTFFLMTYRALCYNIFSEMALLKEVKISHSPHPFLLPC